VQRFPLLSKVAAIGLVMLLLMMALLRISGVVDERRMRQWQAAASVEQSLAGSQTLLGPLLMRDCSEEWDSFVGEGRDRRPTLERRHWSMVGAPVTLQARGDLRAEARYRGLFKVNGYGGSTVLRARWAHLAALQPTREHLGGRLQCGPVRVLLSVSDVRGLRAVKASVDDLSLDVQSGTGHPRYTSGLHAVLSDARSAQVDVPLTATITLDLMGTARLALVPAAGDTQWTLQSDWPHPSFFGRFLPAQRQVEGSGFTARWAVTSLASSAAEAVQQAGELCGLQSAAAASEGEEPTLPATAGKACLDTLGVAFIDPVNPYVLADRATKYALLFIVLTFVCVALTEVLAGRRVHPVQYTLAGLALALFYLLLVSLSEHIGFDRAYIAASAGCVALLGFYGMHMLGSRLAGLVFGAGLALLYALLWVLLQREQTALVIGSLALFAVLAVVMVLTRRLDWYALFDANARDGERGLANSKVT